MSVQTLVEQYEQRLRLAWFPTGERRADIVLSHATSTPCSNVPYTVSDKWRQTYLEASRGVFSRKITVP